jgi:voltage-gated potassium channel
MYWATVTMTTVGYGDLTPQTGLGKVIASFMMLLGWGILAVPTGIVTAEMTAQRSAMRRERMRGPAASKPGRACLTCGLDGHERDARFCRGCGTVLSAAEAKDG